MIKKTNYKKKVFYNTTNLANTSISTPEATLKKEIPNLFLTKYIQRLNSPKHLKKPKIDNYTGIPQHFVPSIKE